MPTKVDEAKSAAVFVEIVRVREQNAEMRDKIRKFEAKDREYLAAKHHIESLEAQVVENGVFYVRVLPPFIDTELFARR